EFSSDRSRFRRELMSAKFCSVHPPVGSRSVGALVGLSWKAPTAMNQNGKMNASANTVSTMYRPMLLRPAPPAVLRRSGVRGREAMSVLPSGAGREGGQQPDPDHQQHADRRGDVGVGLLDALLVDEQHRRAGGAVGAAAVGEQVRLGE